MNTQQAYINGFVKRANEHGLSDVEATDLLKSAITKSEVEDSKASVPLNTLFGWTPLSLLHSTYKDVNSPHDMPSRFLNINIPALAGGALGAALAGRNHGLSAGLAGGLLGAGLGGGVGAYMHNAAIDRYLEKNRHWDDPSTVNRVKFF